VVDNTAQGAWFAGAGTKNVQITGGFFAQNTSGIVFDAVSTDGASVNGAKCGAWGSFTANSVYGIQILAGTANNFTIANCDLRGNTTAAIGDGSTGTGRLKVNNKGYNPQAAVAITVTASPFTYTTGDSPESVTISGGVVTQVALGALVLFAASPCTVDLPAQTAVTVTYTGAPTMRSVPQ
jgi:hypothetical protein